MDKIKPLVESSQLKTNYLSKISKQDSLIFNYEKDADILMMLFISPDIETTVHYLDRNVAILYESDNKEIVGLQIEDFQSEFLPLYSDLQKAWCLSDFEISNDCFWDLTLKVKERKLFVARKIISAKHNIIGKSAKEFERVLEYA